MYDIKMSAINAISSFVVDFIVSIGWDIEYFIDSAVVVFDRDRDSVSVSSTEEVIMSVSSNKNTKTISEIMNIIIKYIAQESYAVLDNKKEPVVVLTNQSNKVMNEVMTRLMTMKYVIMSNKISFFVLHRCFIRTLGLPGRIVATEKFLTLTIQSLKLDNGFVVVVSVHLSIHGRF